MFVAFQALQGSRPSALQDLSGTFTAELHRGSRCFSSSRVHTAGLEFLPWLKEPKSNSRTFTAVVDRTLSTLCAVLGYQWSFGSRISISRYPFLWVLRLSGPALSVQ